MRTGSSRYMTVFLLACMAALPLLFVSPGTSPAAEVVDRIVAVVNGEMITLSDVNQNLAYLLSDRNINKKASSSDAEVQELRRQVLDKMINDILLEQEAKQYAIEVSIKDVQDYLDNFMKENNLTQDQLEHYLQEQGMTLEGYKERIENNIIRTRLLAVMVHRKVVVTDEEIEEYYQAHKHELANSAQGGGETFRLGLIVFDSKKDAETVREEIVQGKVSFSDAAKRHSVGPAAGQGGDLGQVTVRDLVPEIQAVAVRLPSGQVSEPFSLSGKPAIITLEKSSGGGSVLNAGQVPPLDAVRDQIRSRLEAPKMEKIFTEYTQRLREQALVDVRL